MIHPARLESLRAKAARAGWDASREGCLHTSAKVRPIQLIELNPRIARGALAFDCPACCCQQAHRSAVDLPEFDMAASVYDLSIPSIVSRCGWRGRIARGVVESA